MKILFLFILSMLSNTGYSKDSLDTILRGEFYIITEAYLFANDSIYTMHEQYVDTLSKVFFMFTQSSSPDSSTIISIDRGNDKVLYLGYAKEIDPPENFDFLPGKKTFYHWKYNMHDKKEPANCLVIREYEKVVKDQVSLEYYRFHFLFEEYDLLFYCDIPIIHLMHPTE